MQNNGSFHLYAYVVRSGKPLDRKAADFDPDSVAVKQHGEALDTQSLTSHHFASRTCKIPTEFDPSILAPGHTLYVTVTSLLPPDLWQQANRIQ